MIEVNDNAATDVKEVLDIFDVQPRLNTTDFRNSEQYVTIYDVEGNPTSVEVVVTICKEDIKVPDYAPDNSADPIAPEVVNEPNPERSSSTGKKQDHVSSQDPTNISSAKPRLSWLQLEYPELVSLWHSTSNTEFYQGGVQLLCSRCKIRLATGFHCGLALCEMDRKVGPVNCSVCMLRPSVGFHHGLAMCEEDRLFLASTFSQRLTYPRCAESCSPTPRNWCGYCRLRTCLSSQGFRFMTGPGSRPLVRRRKIGSSTCKRQLSFLPRQTRTSPRLLYYDGSRLGQVTMRSGKVGTRGRGRSGRVSNRWLGGDWVRKQQLKYFGYHLELYKSRNGPY